MSYFLSRVWIFGLVSLCFVFSVGYLQGSGHYTQTVVAYRLLIDEYRALVDEHRALEKTFSELKLLQMASEVSADVDRQALEKIRKVVVRLDYDLSVQSEELNLYRNVVQNQQVVGKTLQISNFLLRPTEEPQVFFYRFVIRKTEGLNKKTKVGFSAGVEGEMAGKTAHYTLSQLDPAVEKSTLTSTIKYFHIAEGVLHLPEGFQPKTFTIKAWLARKKKNASQLQVPWAVTAVQ